MPCFFSLYTCRITHAHSYCIIHTHCNIPLRLLRCVQLTSSFPSTGHSCHVFQRELMKPRFGDLFGILSKQQAQRSQAYHGFLCRAVSEMILKFIIPLLFKIERIIFPWRSHSRTQDGSDPGVFCSADCILLLV